MEEFLKIVGYVNKTMVFCVTQREGHVWTKMVEKADGSTLKQLAGKEYIRAMYL